MFGARPTAGSTATSLVVIHRDILAPSWARDQCPLVVGVGEEMFLASSIAAFLRETRRVQLIEDSEVVAIHPDGVQFVSVAGGPVPIAARWSRLGRRGGREAGL